MSKDSNESVQSAIAIIGMVCRFPGATTLEEYWNNLSQGKETISFFSEEELAEAGVPREYLSLPNYVRARGVYKDPLHFDAQLFGYTPRDAELLDPQQRVFLECSWEALEMAGYDPHAYPGRVGVFAGTGITYYLFSLLANRDLQKLFGLNMMASNDKDYVATRVGYKLNLRGPCVSVQTACSTSLVATVLGCQSLLNYQSDMVLAGGSSIQPAEKGGYQYEDGGISSPDGHCRSFDAQAKGTIFSSGAGVLVLKRFEDAERDRDHIYGLIRGFAINNDGSRRVGFTAPGVDGQTSVTTEALVMSGINPESISYVECHGTGTVLGDPIEIKALSQAFSKFTKKKNYCPIGSVKSNIGHTDTAAGVAGVIKTVLAMNRRQIPPSLHFKHANPEIRFEDTPFFVNTTLRDWKSEERLRAGVNSFGVGGTNAHVILEEAPAPAPGSVSRRAQLLLWSARTPSALDKMTSNLHAFLSHAGQASLPDIAFTHQVGRHHFSHRRFTVAGDMQGTARATAGDAPLVTLEATTPAPKVIFLFPGQGSQHVNMGRELYASEPAFRDTFDRCSDLFEQHLNEDLRKLIYASPAMASSAAERLQQTKFTQPALFAIEYSLAKLWEEWGIRPWAMLGHSIGEYVAACLAGVMRLSDAISIVSARGTLMQSLPAGAMLSVLLAESDLAKLLQPDDGVSLAAVNGPSACVISGPSERIDAISLRLSSNGIANRRLKTSHAFHSSMMDPMLETFREQMKSIRLSPPNTPYLSNLTGGWIREEEATSPEYWVRHLRSTVRFGAAVGELLAADKKLILLEVGPGSTLTSLARAQIKPHRGLLVASLPPAKQESSAGDLVSMLTALGSIWGSGVDPDWRAFYAREQRRRVPTVAYPFERSRYAPAGYGLAHPEEAQSAVSEKSQVVPFEEWFSTVTWSRTAPLQKGDVAPGAKCIFLADFSDLSNEIARGMKDRGLSVTMVTSGAEFCMHPNGSYTLRPEVEEDYHQLFMSLQLEAGEKPVTVVHAWAIDNVLANEYEHCSMGLERSFFSALLLIRAIGRQFSHTPVAAYFLSNCYDITGDERSFPLGATVFGPSSAAAREYELLSTRQIDLKYPAYERADIHLLLDEITRPDVGDVVVGLRGGYRWKREKTSLTLSDAAAGAGFRENGTYLVTGGLRGIGLAAARYIATQVRANIILVGRTALPPEQNWQDHLANAQSGDPLKESIEGIIALRKLGADVLVRNADVSNLEQITAVVADTRSRFGAVNGVIHSAGVPGSGIIELKHRESAEPVLRPKVHGALVLEQALADEDLDFFLLYSSPVALVGGVGQADYTAANAYLDAFASSRRKSPKNRPIAIAWDRWEDVGMAARQAQAQQAITNQGAQRPEGVYEELNHHVFNGRFASVAQQTYLIRVAPKTHWVAGEHKIMGLPTMVGTSHLEHVRSAYALSGGEDACEISDLTFIQPVILQPDEERSVYYTLDAWSDNRRNFVVWSNMAGQRVEHARGKIGSLSRPTPPRLELLDVRARCPRERSTVLAEGVSTDGQAAAIQLSERWAAFEHIVDSDVEALAEIRLTATHIRDLEMYMMHPAVLDCATSFGSGPSVRAMYLPLAYQKLSVFKRMPDVLYSHKRFRNSDSLDPEVLVCDVTLADASGEAIIEIEGFILKRVGDPGALKAARTAPAAALTDTASSESARAAAIAKKFYRRIELDQGLRALHRIIAAPYSAHVIVDTRGITIEQELKQIEDSAAQGTAEIAAANAYPRPPLSTAYVEPRSELEMEIVKIWEAVLGIDGIGVHDDFIELGGHSLLGIQITSRVSETFGIEFSVSEFYQASDVEGMAKLLIARLTQDLQDEPLQELLEAETISR